MDDQSLGEITLISWRLLDFWVLVMIGFAHRFRTGTYLPVRLSFTSVMLCLQSVWENIYVKFLGVVHGFRDFDFSR